MLYWIILLIFLIVFFKCRMKINQIYQMYKKYKLFVDPNNKLSHIQIIKNLNSLFLTILYSTYSIYYQSYDTNNKKDINPIKFNKKYVKISYKYKDKNYHYLLKIPRGVYPLKSITDEEDNDISDIIEPYLGPNLDCHGSSIYPKDFGYNKIKIKTIFDNLIIFEEDQKIEL